MMEALRAAAPDQPVESVVENGGTGVPHVSPPKAVNPVSATGKTSWKAKCLILKGKCDRIDQVRQIHDLDGFMCSARASLETLTPVPMPCVTPFTPTVK